MALTTEITLDAGEFTAAVGWAAKWIDARSVTPVQLGLLLEVDANAFLTVGAFSENAVARDVVSLVDPDGPGGEALHPGQVIVSGRLLAELAGTLGRAKTVTLVSEGEAVRMTAGRFTATLPAMDSQDWPTLMSRAPTVCTVPGAQLAAAVARVSIAAKRNADSDSQIAWTALALSFAAGGLDLAATDRSRVAMAALAWLDRGDNPALADDPLVTPSAGVLMDAAASFATAQRVEIGLAGTVLSLSSSVRSVTMRTIDIAGNGYPIGQVRAFFARPTTAAFTLSASDAVLPLKRARYVRAKDGPIRVTVRPGEMEIGATQSDSKATSGDVVDIAGYDGEEFTLGMDPVLFGEALSTAPGDEITIRFTPDPTKPFVLECADDPTWRHMLMPRRIDL